MKIYVTRHGETDFNRLGIYSGSVDIPLNKHGFAQARKLANRLQEKTFDAVVSSPMLRARQTAEIICSALNTTYTLEELLKERALGVYEGLTKGDVQLRYPILWKRQCTINPVDAPDGGESAYDVCLRVKIALTNLYDIYKGKTILIITHGFTSRAIHMLCLNNQIEKLRDFTLGNCEVATYTIRDIMLLESL